MSLEPFIYKNKLNFLEFFYQHIFFSPTTILIQLVVNAITIISYGVWASSFLFCAYKEYLG